MNKSLELKLELIRGEIVMYKRQLSTVKDDACRRMILESLRCAEQELVRREYTQSDWSW